MATLRATIASVVGAPALTAPQYGTGIHPAAGRSPATWDRRGRQDGFSDLRPDAWQAMSDDRALSSESRMRDESAWGLDRALMHRVRSEYLEIPGLSLTVDQAVRLWGVERTTCAAVLEVLARDGFLRVSRRGAYVRATSA